MNPVLRSSSGPGAALTLAFAVLPCVLPLGGVGCTESDTSSSAAKAAAPSIDEPAPASPSSTAVPTDQTADLLLSLAFEAASALPTNPHLKNRCRAQHEVFDACVEMGLYGRARQQAEAIDNWRRGVAFGDLAFALAGQGRVEETTALLEEAEKVLGWSEEAFGQAWRRNRVQAAVIRARMALGENQAAAEMLAQVTELGELGPVLRYGARSLRPEDFDDRLADIRVMAGLGDFQRLENTLGECAELYRLFYAEPERREALVEATRECWLKVPLPIRMRTLCDFARVALDAGEAERALSWIREGHELLDSMRLTPDVEFPLLGWLVVLQHAAGETAPARRHLERAREIYASEKATIVDIARADVLRPLAEAYQQIGQAEQALQLYRQAVEAGVQNPNSRPRVDDLVATCASLVRHRVTVGDELTGRLAEIRAGLGEPW